MLYAFMYICVYVYYQSFEDVDGNTVFLASLSNKPNTFACEFARRKFGVDCLRNHIFEPKTNSKRVSVEIEKILLIKG